MNRLSSRCLICGVALAIAPSFLGCGKDDPGPSQNSGYYSMSVGGLKGGLDLNVNGIQLDVDETVSFTYVLRTGEDPVMSIDGLPAELRNGSLEIGEHQFDGLTDGDLVLLSKNGISVNGERRWDWPVE